jgi:hypothetical protein
MKDKSSDDACRNGNDSAPQPIRKNAKAKYRHASPKSDFDKDRSHSPRLYRADLGRCPYCFAVALAQNKEREKRQWPKDQGHVELGAGRSATVASHCHT